jgi:hypothetical protein
MDQSPSTISERGSGKLRRAFVCVAAAFLLALGGYGVFAGAVLPRINVDFRELCEQAVEQTQGQILDRIERQECKEYLEKHADEDGSITERRAAWQQTIAALSLPMRESAGPVDLKGLTPSPVVTREDADHWSFVSLDKPNEPDISDKSWPRNGIDRFVLSALESAGLKPTTSASATNVCRRLCFDMHGLPPDDSQWSFAPRLSNNCDYDAFIEQLMAQPAFGERWARVWLDVSRYSDSNGYEEDEIREHAYPYRDFVTWAMNSDLPYDEFVRWQIAGDELQPSHPMAVAATGFCTAGSYNTFMPQPEERSDELDDIVGTLFSTTLGLSVRCARCHDHMYDAIPSRDYYGLVAVFSGTKRHHAFLVPDQGSAYREFYDPLKALQDEVKDICRTSLKEDRISALDYFTEKEQDLLRQPIDPANSEQTRLLSLCERCLLITDSQLDDDIEPLPQDLERYRQLMDEINKLEIHLPESPPIGLTLSGSEIAVTPVLDAGQYDRPGELVGPGFLTALTRHQPEWSETTWQRWLHDKAKPKPRSALAHWITDSDSGPGSLLARVIVNRLWQQHFGRGLVATADDFGVMGDAPSHPELLEWLACELVESDWSLKHIHRLIVTSATYRQSADCDHRTLQADPENVLISRQSVRRLTAEMIRDAILAISGNLDRQMYGPGVRLPIPEEAVYTEQIEGNAWPTDIERDRKTLFRRTLYTIHRRTMPNPFLQLFDSPTAGFSCGQRSETTVPTQALALWNAPFVLRQSKRFGERVVTDSGSSQAQDFDNRDVIERLFQLAYGREPDSIEVNVATTFLQGDSFSDTDQMTRLADLCQVVLMSNEFLFTQ